MQGTLFFSHWLLTGLTVAPGAGGDHQVHAVGLDQLGRDLGRVLLIGLAVFFQDFDGISCAVDRDAAGNRLADSGEDEIVAFAKAGEGAGARADEANLERAACGAGGFSEEQVRLQRPPPRRLPRSPVGSAGGWLLRGFLCAASVRFSTGHSCALSHQEDPARLQRVSVLDL